MAFSKRYFLIFPVVAGLTLILYGLTSKPLWGDEYFTWSVIFSGGFPERVLTDIHPPLYYIMLLPLEKLFTDGLFAIRLFSAVCAIFAILLGWILCRRYHGVVAGDYFLLLAPLSCHLLLFSRMGRYYSLLMLLVILSQFALDRLIERKGWWNAALYALSLAACFYTNLISLLLVPVHIIIVLLRRKPLSFPLAGQTFALVSLLAWIPMVYKQLEMKESLSPFANDITLNWTGFLARIFWPIYDFSFGENIPPWDWFFSIPGMILITVAFVWFLLKGNRRGEIITLMLLILVPAAVITGFVIPVGIEFLPSRLMFLLPFWLMAIAAGISHMPRTFRIVTTVVLIFISLTGICRYYRDVSTFHSTYIIPWAEIAHVADEVAGRSGLIISDDETIAYYLRDDRRLKFLSIIDEPKRLITGGRSIVLVANPRDLTPGGMLSTFTDLLESKHYVVQESWEFVLEDENSIAIKQKLLGRDVSRVKKVVRLYVPETRRRSGRFEYTTYNHNQPPASAYDGIRPVAGVQGSRSH